VSTGDVEFSADNLRFFAGAARLLDGKAAGEYTRGYTSMIRREPVGVVASIAPWNYPLLMTAWKIGPALAAGNTVVLKPSELTPMSALRVAELAADIFPPGVLNVITGRGEPVGAGLVRHAGVDMVSLTGDVSTGKKVAEAAAGTVKRAHLELGGKAPAVIFDDANVRAAAAGIRRSSFYNSGQDCTAAARILVHEHVYDEFLSELLPKVGAIKLGDPLAGEDVDMGSLISAAHRNKVGGFLERAQEGGASVLVGGEPVEGPRVLLQAHRRRGGRAVRRDSAEGSLRTSDHRPAVPKRRGSPAAGERLTLRPHCLRVVGEVGTSTGRGEEAQVRHRVDQRAH
jgi:acyl-CoA reductase-like NAD-dependent aldehyde dehydrogenase